VLTELLRILDLKPHLKKKKLLLSADNEFVTKTVHYFGSIRRSKLMVSVLCIVLTTQKDLLVIVRCLCPHSKCIWLNSWKKWCLQWQHQLLEEHKSF